MRLRLISAGLFVASIVAAVAAFAQQPPIPPAAGVPGQTNTPPAVTVPQSVPGTPTNPALALRSDAPLSKFEPLSVFPVQTQTAVRSSLLAAHWLTRMNQSHGRFIAGFNPALRQPLQRDNDVFQARAALAMAQLARFTGDEKQGVVASQAILTLLSTTKSDAACRTPTQSPQICNRVGLAATLALAIYALPNASDALIADAELLCEYLHKQCQADGSVVSKDGGAEAATENDGVNGSEYPGLALQAIAAGNRVRPAPWKNDVLKKALAYYRNVFHAKPHPVLAAALTPAFADFYVQTKTTDPAAFVFEMNDWLCRLQIPGNDPRLPQWGGGFRCVVNGQQTDTPSGPETGFFLRSLSCACQVARNTPDLERFDKYKTAAMDASQYLSELQFVESNTRHFESAFRANMLIGSFHLTPTDGTVRVDATGTAVSGLMQFLETVADR
jgi:hypothetical protein